MIVLGLLATVLTGFIGSTAEANVLLYTEQASNISVQGAPYSLDSGMNRIPVLLNVSEELQHEKILVTADSITYELPLTILGKHDYTKLWWLLVIPAIMLLMAVRIRAGSS